MFMIEGVKNEFREGQQIVRARDNELALAAKVSKSTLRRSYKDGVPTETGQSIREALVALGRERVESITRWIEKTTQAAG
jgi:hypothetical protein